MSLKKQAVSGMVWTFAQQFGTQIIYFVISLLLARLLTPSDFGTIAMFTVVISISSALIEGGMVSSLIRTLNADDTDLSTVFWFNVSIAIVMYFVVFASAPLIADFYKLKSLTNIIRVYAIILIIKSFISVQAIRFVKSLDFKTSFKIQLPSLIIGGSLGILLAYNGFGVWSLVIFPLTQSLISSVQYWFYSDWRPSFLFDNKKFKYHFNFGYKMTLSSLLVTIFSNINAIIIGKMFSPAQLGYYNRAENLKQLPVTNLSTALNKVTFPLFAKLSHDNIKLKEVYKKLMKVVIFIIAPVLFLSIVIAEPLIRFLLTEKWLPAVPYFQILALTGILHPIHAYNLNILMVKGKSDLFLRLEIIKKVLVSAILFFSLQYGIFGILWGQVVFSILAFFINTFYTGKILKYGSIQQIADLLPVLFLSVIIAVAFHYLDFYFFKDFKDIVRLGCICSAYSFFYLGFALVLKFKEVNYIKDLLKNT
jgi:O-antigen/teichoic acid export membrane protein